MVRQGAIDSPPKCPIILGFECAGEIEQVGEGVEGFSVSILLKVHYSNLGILVPVYKWSVYNSQQFNEMFYPLFRA